MTGFGMFFLCLCRFFSLAASLPADKLTTTTTTTTALPSEVEATTGGQFDRNIQIGNLSVTTRLIKSPKSIYVINKMIFLTPNSLVQVKPEDILVMSRPYGPAKVFYWLTSTYPHSSFRRSLLYHAEDEPFSVILWKQNVVKIFCGDSQFVVTGKSEGGGSGGPSSFSSTSSSSSSSSSDQAGGDTFNYLSVQLSKTKPKMVNAIFDSLTTTAPSAGQHPVSYQPKRRFTYWQEIRLFFVNVARLIHLGAEYIRSIQIISNLTNMIDLYRPRFNGYN